MVLFLVKGLNGFFLSPLLFFQSIISFVNCLIILCILSISVGSFSFLSEFVFDVRLFLFPLFSKVENLFSSFPV